MAAEAVLVGSPPDAGVVRGGGRGGGADLDPPSDLHGSTAYRRHVATVLARRSLEQAAAEIGAGR